MSENYVLIKCPYCENDIFIMEREINCAIFRHGVYKTNMEPIPPHSTMDQCEYLVKHNLIYGCGKPFRLVNENNMYVPYKSDYI